MWNGETESSIGDLPQEMITEITNLLPLVDKKTCKSVNTQWNYIVSNFCNNNMKFSTVLDNTSLDPLLVTNLIFDIIYMEGLTQRLPRMSHPKNNFPNMKHVEICGANSQAATMNMLKYGLNDTTSLVMDTHALQHVQRYVISGNMQHFNWIHLMKFELNVDVRYDKKHLDSSSTLLKFAKMTNLRQFYFTFFDTAEIKNLKIQIKRLYLNMYKFLFNNSKTLIELNLSIICVSGPLGYEIPKVPDSIECNMNIETCKLFLNNGVRGLRPEYLISPELIGSNLKSLNISYGNTGENDGNYFDKLVPVFEANVQTLENIMISANTYQDDGRVNLFWLNNCPLLKSFYIDAKNLMLPENCVFSHPFQLSICNEVASCIEYQQLFVKLGNNIEHLTLEILEMDEIGFHELDDDDELEENELVDNNLLWLNSCISLKYLSLSARIGLLLSNENITLPNLTEFKMCFKNDDQVEETQVENNWNWIKQNMPNLQILKMCADYDSDCLITPLTCLQKVFTMEKLNKIYFDNSGVVNHLNEKNLIIKHCDDTPGLHYKKFHVPANSNNNILGNLILIDRLIYDSS